MVTKEKLIETINSMPETFSVDDLIERIMFLEKIEKGLEQSEKNMGTPHADVKRKFEEWSK